MNRIKGKSRFNKAKAPRKAIHPVISLAGLLLVYSVALSACSNAEEPVKISQHAVNEASKHHSQHRDNVIDTIGLSYGRSFGECKGYCHAEMTVYPWGIEIKKINNHPKPYENKVAEYTIPFSESEYLQLVKLIPFARFIHESETVGCPDCNDGGAEWISVQVNGSKKSIRFPYGSSFENADSLLLRLRSIFQRNENLSYFAGTWDFRIWLNHDTTGKADLQATWKLENGLKNTECYLGQVQTADGIFTREMINRNPATQQYVRTITANNGAFIVMTSSGWNHNLLVWEGTQILESDTTWLREEITRINAGRFCAVFFNRVQQKWKKTQTEVLVRIG